jgi:glutamine amidotransferase
MTVVLLDSGGANIGSVRAALARLGVDAPVTSDAATVRGADRVILPGVGAAGPAMAMLRSNGLDAVIPTLTQPLLGICLGMQLLFEASDEGDVACLGLLPGRARRFDPARCGRVPHMGWNALLPRRASPLTAGLGPDAYAYFVHSYAVAESEDTVAACDYGGGFSAVVNRGNVFGVQFHPEKSAEAGASCGISWRCPWGRREPRIVNPPAGIAVAAHAAPTSEGKMAETTVMIQ